MFTSLEEVKAVAEKFEAGKIVPRRVFKIEGKGEKKARSDLLFARNLYRLSGKGGYHVFLCDFKEDLSGPEYFARLKGHHKNLNIQGASHGKSGNLFLGNLGISDDECLDNINKAVFGKMVVEV